MTEAIVSGVLGITVGVAIGGTVVSIVAKRAVKRRPRRPSVPVIDYGEDEDTGEHWLGVDHSAQSERR